MIKYYPKERQIKIAMAKKGFNQRDLSKVTRFNPSTISNFLTGRYNISPSGSRRVAKALDCEIEEIFEIEVDGEFVKD